MAALNPSRSLLLSSKACRRYPSTISSIRSIANSANKFQTTEVPESPDYVDYPKAPQPDFADAKPIKGVLPIPRDVFKHRSKTPKNSEEFLQQSAPEPSTSKPRAGPRAQWKQRMAVIRRQNLKEGISELSTRRVKTEKITSTKSLERQHRNRELLLSAEAEDERLTRPTMDIALRNFLNGGAAPLKETSESIEARRHLHQARQEAKAQERQDALQTLYTHAREFIVTESQLNDAVDRAFNEDESESKIGNVNVWRHRGAPKNIAAMLKKSMSEDGQKAVTQGRMKRIAESLTGGKI